jgi:restriction endonuclease
VDLNTALSRFDVVETNLSRLEKVIEDYDELVPDGISFTAGSPEGLRADELRAAYAEILATLPAIDGWRMTAELVDLDDIAQARFDANEISEPEILIRLGKAMAEPMREAKNYRRGLARQRRLLVRERARLLLTEIDRALAELAVYDGESNAEIEHPRWDDLKTCFAELERLLGGGVLHRGRWPDLKRHLAFGLGVDLRDIIDHDWPDVRPRIEEGLYDALEPLPVEVADLADVVADRPSGPVSTRLAWEDLAPEDFERLIFNLLTTAGSYENVEWAMRTNAPDRGRDIAAYRVSTDPLSGVHRARVAVQCKHWTTKSVRPDDVSSEITSVQLWDNPPIDVLIIVTSGRLTMDAISWIEKHNAAGTRPRIEYWTDSHLESLLAQRPDLVTEFHLRH